MHGRVNTMGRQIIPNHQRIYVSASPAPQIDRLLCLSVIKLLTINLSAPPSSPSLFLPGVILYMNDYTFINAWVVMCLSNDPYATEKQWHRLLHRCSLRNLLINSVVYVSRKTSLCQGKQQSLGEWRMTMERQEEVGVKGAGGWIRFPRELIEDDSSKNKIFWASCASCNGIRSAELGARPCSPLSFHSSSVDWLQVSACCIICHCSKQEQKLLFFARALQPSALSKAAHSDCCFSSRPASKILRASSWCPKPPLALNNTSRHAVRDQLTLKLLDFTLKSPAPQMSAEFCRQFWLIHAQTLPEGTQAGESTVARVMVHMSIQLLNFSVWATQIRREGTSTNTQLLRGIHFTYNRTYIFNWQSLTQNLHFILLAFLTTISYQVSISHEQTLIWLNLNNFACWWS